MRQQWPGDNNSGNFEIHPKGKFVVEIADVKRLENKNDAPNWQLTLKSYKGTLIHFMNFTEKSMKYNRSIYFTLGIKDGYDPEDITELVGKQAQVEVVHNGNYANAKYWSKVKEGQTEVPVEEDCPF